MALQFRSPLPRKPVRFAVYGFDVGDGCVLLVDRHGQRIGVMPSEDIGMPSRLAMSMLAWDVQIGRMVEKFSRQLVKRQYPADMWLRKVEVWMTTQRPSRRCRSYTRFFSPEKRKTWDDAMRCMRAQFKNAEHKAKVLKSDPWNQWAETVSRNHRRKGDGDGNAKPTASDDRRAAVQVCWDWGRASA